MTEREEILHFRAHEIMRCMQVKMKTKPLIRKIQLKKKQCPQLQVIVLPNEAIMRSSLLTEAQQVGKKQVHFLKLSPSSTFIAATVAALRNDGGFGKSFWVNSGWFQSDILFL